MASSDKLFSNTHQIIGKYNITGCIGNIDNNPKKDDLCDAFLHGVHYIEKNLECENKAKKKVLNINITSRKIPELNCSKSWSL